MIVAVGGTDGEWVETDALLGVDDAAVIYKAGFLLSDELILGGELVTEGLNEVVFGGEFALQGHDGFVFGGEG